MGTQLTSDDFDYIDSEANQSDSILKADTDIATNVFGLTKSEFDENSYLYGKDAAEDQLQKAYQDRDSQMREQHIVPVADISDGDFSQDKLDAIDSQIQDLNKTTRSSSPFLTNDQIKQNLVNRIQQLQYETAAGQANEGILGNIGAHIMSWVGSVPYNYKRSLVDFGANAAMLAGGALTAGLSGGLGVGAEAAISSTAMAASGAYDQDQENEALKVYGLKGGSITKAAESGAISGAIMAPIGLAFHSLGKGIGKAIGKRIIKNMGEESADTLIQAAHSTTDLVEKDSILPPIKDELTPPVKTKISYNNFIKLSPEFDRALESPDVNTRAEAISALSNTDHVRQRYDLYKSACRR